MTIRSIDAIAVALPFEIGGPKPMFSGKPRNMDILLVRVETHDGLVGWGEAFGFAVWPATRTALDELVKPIALGRDESDIAGLADDLARKLHLLGRTGPVMYAISGLDIALWDLAGKRAGRPLAALLGGAQRTRLPAYASLLRYGDPTLVARNAAAAVARGFSAIKLHETTVDNVAAARRAIGPDVKLMVDVNCPWTVDQALAIASGIAPFDVHWFEEPVFPPEDYKALARVRRAAGMPIAAGENAVSAVDFERMFETGAVDHAQPSVTKIGGVTGMLQVIGIAREHGAALAPHSPYVGPGLLATMHLIAARVPEALVEYSHVDLGANPLGEAILARDGMLTLPDAPGLGCDPDPAVVARFRC